MAISETQQAQQTPPVLQRSFDGVNGRAERKALEVPKLDFAVSVSGAPVQLAAEPVHFHKDFLNVTEYHMTNGFTNRQ